MENNWQIKSNSSDPTFGYLVESEQTECVYTYFFTGVSIESYPKMIMTVSDEIGYQSNSVGVNFSHDDDEIPVHMIEIYHLNFGEEQLLTSDFFEILYSFASKIKDKSNMHESWKNEMEKALVVLNQKIKSMGMD